MLLLMCVGASGLGWLFVFVEDALLNRRLVYVHTSEHVTAVAGAFYTEV